MRRYPQARHIVRASILLSAFILPAAATYVALHIAQKHIAKSVKHGIIAGMDREELVLLQFTVAESQSQLEWEHDREFSYAGHMYDIVEQEQCGDVISYWCWRDDAETAIKNQLQSLMNRTAGSDTNNVAFLVSFLHTLCVPEQLPGVANPDPGIAAIIPTIPMFVSKPILRRIDRPPKYV